MRVTIDIADTPAGAAPVEVRVPGQETVAPGGAGEIAGGGVPGIRRYDGGADLGAPAPTEPMAEAGTPAPAAPEPGTARDGGAAPGTAETATSRLIPTQIEAPGGRAPAG
jgi:hypothetical protein